MKRRFKKNIICFVLIIAIIIASAAVVKRTTVGEAENYSKYIQVAAEDKNISAKKMIKNYADENGYTLSDYPQSLVDLLKRNKETKEFVLNYPKYKDKHFKINMKEYKKAESGLIDYLSKIDIERAEKAENAPHLVKLSTLKELSLKGKMKDIEVFLNEWKEISEEKSIRSRLCRKLLQKKYRLEICLSR